jgi:uncharacterized protein
MSHPEPVAAAIIILFASTVIRSAVGFGDGLVAMPLLTMAVGIRTASPVVAFAASTIAITILLGNWRKVDLRSAWRLILASLVGIPLGIGLLRVAPESLVKSVLGVVLILYGLYRLIRPVLPAVKNENLAYIFGFAAGVLGGAYNTNGPPVVIYGALRRWPPEHFRATLQYYFLPTGLMIVAGHGLAGLWTPLVLRLFLYSLPFILLATYLGGIMHKHIPIDLFSRILHAFLVVMGVLFLVLK